MLVAAPQGILAMAFAPCRLMFGRSSPASRAMSSAAFWIAEAFTNAATTVVPPRVPISCSVRNPVETRASTAALTSATVSEVPADTATDKPNVDSSADGRATVTDGEGVLGTSVAPLHPTPPPLSNPPHLPILPTTSRAMPELRLSYICTSQSRIAFVSAHLSSSQLRLSYVSATLHLLNTTARFLC